MITLFTGPWVGEFGWELFGWQGYIRSLSSKFHRIIVCCKPGHEVLYKDFATQIIQYPVEGGETQFWKCKDFVYNNIHEQYKHDEMLMPSDIHCGRYKGKIVQKFVNFGKPSSDKCFDILYHARSTTKVNSGGRNWPEENWKELLGNYTGKKIAAIGSKNGAYHIPGTDDLRGISLGDLTNYMASSKLLLGPSSGPIHLGSLCRIPHIVWTDDGNWSMPNKVRYETGWNPFRTQVVVIVGKTWKPTVERVLEEVELLC